MTPAAFTFTSQNRLFVFKAGGGGVEAVSGLGVLGSQGFSACLLLTPVIKCEVFYGSDVNRLRLWANYLIQLIFFMSQYCPFPLYQSFSVKLFHLPRMTFFPWHAARSSQEYSDAHAACLGLPKTSWSSVSTSPSDSCVFVRVLCCNGGGQRKGWAQLRAVIRRWARNGKTCGLRSSGWAACPHPANQQPCSWGQQSAGDLQQNPVVLCHSETSPKHYLPI